MCLFETLLPHNKRRPILLIKDKDKNQSSPLAKIFPSLLATIRNKRKLAAVWRETPESTRNRRGQNSLDPDLTQDYISQVSEEIEGGVTKKLSKEFSRTESRILCALSNLDEFLPNPKVRTCSVAVPGTSRNNNSKNRETTGDRSSGDPCPKARSFFRHSGQISSPEAKTDPHNSKPQICWLQSNSNHLYPQKCPEITKKQFLHIFMGEDA